MASSMAEKERKFISVEHPCTVTNADKLLTTLKGIDKISSTYSNPSHRLELYFRPTDQFCKPTFGDRFNTTNLLLKVKKKKTIDGKIELNTEILGVVGTTYKFQSLVDFQMLPMQRVENKYVPINKDLLPKTLEKTDWFKQDTPLFVLPPVFTRLDNPGDYYFGKDPTKRQENIHSEMPFVTQCLRYRRTLHSISLYFEDTRLPTRPLTNAVNQLKEAGGEDMLPDSLKLFEHQPIWQRNALLVELKTTRDKLKLVLPVIAYTFVSGPWRGLWVRLGYDPRQDPNANIYQILDFRIRQGIARNISLKSKRSSAGYILPNKISQSVGRIPLIQAEGSTSFAVEDLKDPWDELKLTYKFDPQLCPPARQLFYQFCDIDVPEINQLVLECPKASTCHEKFGWLDGKTYEQCRNILASIVQSLCKDIDKEQEDDGSDKTTAMDSS